MKAPYVTYPCLKRAVPIDERLLPPPYKPKENAEEQARIILENLRWPAGIPKCPLCGAEQPIYKEARNGVRGYYRCPRSHPAPQGNGKPLVFTVRTDTILARSHLPLDKWLHCLNWYARIPDQPWRKGPPIPATKLAQIIHVNRKTASSLLKELDNLRFKSSPDDAKNHFLIKLIKQP